MKKFCISTLAFACSIQCSSALAGGNQALASDARVSSSLALLETWVESKRINEQIPGISMAIVSDQEMLWSRGFGYADLDSKTPASSDTIYGICSVSKLFTSIGVMQLRDQGKLSLSDSVKDHLPWFNIQQSFPESSEITIESLLTHTSGLPRESDFPYWTAPDFETPTRQQMIEKLPTQKTLYPVSAHYEYSNLGMILAGEIIAARAGESYAEYIQENILSPLELQDTSSAMPEAEQRQRLAAGYSSRNRAGERQRLPEFNARAITAAGGFSSTVEDLSRLMSWQFRQLAGADSTVLKSDTLREMQQSQKKESARGLGFHLLNGGDYTLTGHFGLCPGHQSAVFIEPTSRIGVAVLVNHSERVNRATPKLLTQAFNIVAPALMAAKSESDNTKESDSKMALYRGSYDIFPWGGEMAVLPWQDGLAMITLPSDNPLQEMMLLKHESGHQFRRVRADKTLAEPIEFDLDQQGKVVGLRRHSNYFRRVD